MYASQTKRLCVRGAPSDDTTRVQQQNSSATATTTSEASAINNQNLTPSTSSISSSNQVPSLMTTSAMSNDANPTNRDTTNIQQDFDNQTINIPPYPAAAPPDVNAVAAITNFINNNSTSTGIHILGSTSNAPAINQATTYTDTNTNTRSVITSGPGNSSTSSTSASKGPTPTSQATHYNSQHQSATTGTYHQQPIAGNSSSNTNNNNPVDATSGMGNIPSFATVSMVTSDTEPDDIEMSRLQAILEARGVPSHLLGALGPRMHTLLHRTIGSSSSSKAHQLVQGLKAHGDEGQQLQTVMEMCQLLVMGNEDTLAGFPVKLAVPNLIQLLNMEHNFDIMNHACRALTYMMESLPRSASVVVDAVPSFLEKLQVIQCMDVAEQSLTALEMLSRRHSRAILHARGASACLTYLDFFSINAQRCALTIAANCCQNITPEEFTYIQDSLVTLSSHLTSTDKKSVESIILAFSRLVEHYQNEPSILMEVASGNLLDNLTQLLLATPSVISINTFVMIIRMLALMCKSCPELAVRLMSSNIVQTVRYLLVGQRSTTPSVTNTSTNTSICNKSVSDNVGASNFNITTSSAGDISMSSTSFRLCESVELLNRTPQELYELTSLIAELMPRLPSGGIFSVNALMDKENISTQESVIWQWRDDRGIWHRYNAIDNKLIDSAHRAGDEDVTLVTMGKTYTIDFTTMQQINEETELSRPVQRKINHQQLQPQTVLTDATSSATPSSSSDQQNLDTNRDPRVDYIERNPAILENFAQSLFGVLYEIYSSSAGPSVRHKCLSAFLRIIYYCPTDALRQLLKCHPVSSHIAAMLASADQRILVGAIQMALILMDKLPDIFSIYFRREGVMHQFKRLANKAGCSSSPGGSVSSKKDEVKGWIVKQAQAFEDRTGFNAAGDPHNAMDILNKLTCALEMLDENMIEALQQLKSVLSDGDISSFELIHSGLVSKLVKFLTNLEGCTIEDRDTRIRSFLSVFLGLPQDPRHLLLLLNEYELKIDPLPFSTLVSKLNACISQLEQFPVRVHDFAGLGNGNTRGASALKFFNTHQLKCNLQRHPQCNNLRTWKGGPVKIDPLAIVQAIEKYLTVRGYAKIRESADNSDDNSGDEMDDSMTMMTQPSGRHRLQLSIGDRVLPYNMTVYQAIRQFGGNNMLGANVDIDESDLQVVGHSNMWTETHTIYYRPYVEPQPSVTTSSGSTSSGVFNNVYLTKRSSRSQTAASSSLKSNSADLSCGPSDLRSNSSSYHDPSVATTSAPMNTAAFPQQAQQTSSNRRYNTRNSSSSVYSSNYHRTPAIKKKVDDLWSEGKTPHVVSPVDQYLCSKLPQSVTLKDPSVEIIVLLRAIFGLNRHWSWFYRDGISFYTHQIISNGEFINSKLAAKATRQLQDPLVIMTGNLPNWLPQLTYACPFLIPFDTRQLLFYVTCFDRDRALQRLMDTTPELSNSEERVAPRLERRKKTVNREDLFRQSEIILNELTNSKTVLEIQYENEVGTGLGPTLEFYALVSREMQSADLEMWRGEEVPASQSVIQPEIDQSDYKLQASTSIYDDNIVDNDTKCKRSDNLYCYESRQAKIDSNRNNNNNVYTKTNPTKLSKTIGQTKQAKTTPTIPLPPTLPIIPPQVQSEQSKKYIYSPNGLFPVPMARNTKLGNVSRLRNRFKLLGKFMAKALMDSRMIDMNFSLTFYKWLLSQESSLDLADMVHIDPTMSRSLFHMHRIAQLHNIMKAHKSNSYLTSETKQSPCKSADKGTRSHSRRLANLIGFLQTLAPAGTQLTIYLLTSIPMF